jgi:hypothetical protein
MSMLTLTSTGSHKIYSIVSLLFDEISLSIVRFVEKYNERDHRCQEQQMLADRWRIFVHDDEVDNEIEHVYRVFSTNRFQVNRHA